MKYFEHLTEEDLKNEKWDFVPNTGDRYLISNMGKVFSLPRINERGVKLKGGFMKIQLTKTGYLIVDFSLNGKKIKNQVHRIVGKVFINNTENKPEINHIKGITIDNRFHQLEWATRSEQTLHSFRVLNAPKPKGCLGMKGALNKSSKEVYCINNGKTYTGIAETSRQLGISASSVSAICLGNKKVIKGFVFKFV